MIFEKMVNRTIIQSRYKISIDLAAGRVPSFHQREMIMTMMMMTMVMVTMMMMTMTMAMTMTLTLSRMMMERRLPTHRNEKRKIIFEKIEFSSDLRGVNN